MNITVKTVHICRYTDRYYLWNDRFSVLSRKFCPLKGFLDLFIVCSTYCKCVLVCSGDSTNHLWTEKHADPDQGSTSDFLLLDF